jgi:hypothetical protein
MHMSAFDPKRTFAAKVYCDAPGLPFDDIVGPSFGLAESQ